MQLDDQQIAEFQVLYKHVYGETISADHASEIAQRLLALYGLLLRPLPSEGI